MADEATMRLGNPFLIGVYSLALLTFGAAIGGQWGKNPHTVILMVVIGAVLMVIHDLVTGILFFSISMKWARKISGRRAEPAEGIDVAHQDRPKRAPRH
jgi:hypothetical protein